MNEELDTTSNDLTAQAQARLSEQERWKKKLADAQVRLNMHPGAQTNFTPCITQIHMRAHTHTHAHTQTALATSMETARTEAVKAAHDAQRATADHLKLRKEQEEQYIELQVLCMIMCVCASAKEKISTEQLPITVLRNLKSAHQIFSYTLLIVDTCARTHIFIPTQAEHAELHMLLQKMQKEMDQHTENFNGERSAARRKAAQVNAWKDARGLFFVVSHPHPYMPKVADQLDAVTKERLKLQASSEQKAKDLRYLQLEWERLG